MVAIHDLFSYLSVEKMDKTSNIKQLITTVTSDIYENKQVH